MDNQEVGKVLELWNVEMLEGGKADVVLDAEGLSCPMPLLKAKQALNKMDKGMWLLVRATDAGSVRDFKSFVDLTSHQMLGYSEQQGYYYYLIEKGQ